MAEQADRESRTEQPTEKKIVDEVEKGNIPVSREASVFAFTIAMLAITVFMAKDLLRSVGFILQHCLAIQAKYSFKTVLMRFHSLTRSSGK